MTDTGGAYRATGVTDNVSISDHRRRARNLETEEFVDQPLQLLRHPQPYSIPAVETPVALAPNHDPNADSLRSALRAVRRSWWIILIAAIVATAAGVAIAQSKPRRYAASTYLLLNGNTYQSAIAGGYNPVDPQQQQATIAGLLTPKLLATAAQQSGVPLTDAYSVIATQASANSSVMNIVATTGNDRTSAALANATSRDLVRFMSQNNSTQLQDARSVLNKQIRGARSATDRHALTAQLNNLSDLNALANKQVQVIENATVGSPVSRKVLSIGGIALVLGLLFGLAVSLLRKRKPEPAGG